MDTKSRDWTIQDLEYYLEEAEKLAEEFGLSHYTNQLEIVSADQMIEKSCALGMPMGYYHWSYGKNLIEMEKAYRTGQTGLALELVINSSPCIAYLMENNNLAQQIQVINHASIGHNYVFKNNYMFKEWTNAKMTVDYMDFARNYVLECEERYGIDAVTRILDCAHMLQDYGIDFYKKPRKLSMSQERDRQKERQEFYTYHFNEVLAQPLDGVWLDRGEYPNSENLLYFIEKNAPILKPWERELFRIVRKQAQYFYPQRLTKVINEGMATFVHYWFTYEMYERGLIDEHTIMSALDNHTRVIYQQPYTYLNPYTLGFAILMDIKRMCEEPTDEDREYFPRVVGGDWLEIIKDVVANYRDDNFILTYLSPKVVRDLQLFNLHDDIEDEYIHLTATAEDYQIIKENLAKQYTFGYYTPDIKVWHYDRDNTRQLTLKYNSTCDRIIDKDYKKVLHQLEEIWGYPVKITG